MSKPGVIEFNSHVVDTQRFRQALCAWGVNHYRSYPWRTADDVYALLIGEVMLHRTQASQVAPVYEEFLDRYPTVDALTHASADEVHRVLYPLGLRWRADLLLGMSHALMERFHGVVPQDKAELMSLPGVSEYIASAVRCFGWGLPDPIIDTNTVRVIARLFDLHVTDSLRRSSAMHWLAHELMDVKRPKVYNYALLDLANSVCTQRLAPDCDHCPVSRWCTWAHRNSAARRTNSSAQMVPVDG